MYPIARKIADVFQKYSGEQPLSVVQLPATASDRLYFRIIQTNGLSVIATSSDNIRENNAFISLSKHFTAHKLRVPRILYVNDVGDIYFQEDLGDVSLFSLLQNGINHGNVSDEIRNIYFSALNHLIDFQFKASQNLDYSLCYPVAEFDKTSMLWDLNYFKYYFLKPSGIQFEEDLLEDDFRVLIDAMLNDKIRFFMFRDFQSRNIMIHDSNVWFIDFQGGRKGPVLYDLASCILDAKANLPQAFRNELEQYYYSLMPAHIRPDRASFEQSLSNCMLIRILQAFGAYGFRGMIQKKTLFLQSIPYAAANLKQLLASDRLTLHLPHLFTLLDQIIHKFSKDLSVPKSDKLTIRIYSFSYKKGIPEDPTGHGGGFVFDCRSLPNPGRIAEMQTKTGFDSDVQLLLESDNSVGRFLNSATQMIINAAENYLSRGFTDLMVSFGCTGGQHRSVFCANATEKILTRLFPAEKVNIEVYHRELSR